MTGAAGVAGALAFVALALVGRNYAALFEEALEAGRSFVAVHCKGGEALREAGELGVRWGGWGLGRRRRESGGGRAELGSGGDGGFPERVEWRERRFLRRRGAWKTGGGGCG